MDDADLTSLEVLDHNTLTAALADRYARGDIYVRPLSTKPCLV